MWIFTAYWLYELKFTNMGHLAFHDQMYMTSQPVQGLKVMFKVAVDPAAIVTGTGSESL